MESKSAHGDAGTDSGEDDDAKMAMRAADRPQERDGGAGARYGQTGERKGAAGSLPTSICVDKREEPFPCAFGYLFMRIGLELCTCEAHYFGCNDRKCGKN